MGLSIHYSGTIRSMDLLDDLMTETTDICQSFNWKYHLINEPDGDQLKGIIFSPENCEPLMLTFLPNRRMCSFLNLKHRDIFDGTRLGKELMYTTSTKTQFAGPDTHMALIKLLRYLKEKYFETFELQDEGEYWETGDEKIFLRNFRRYEYLFDTVANILDNVQALPGENVDSLARRIEKILKEKLGGEGKTIIND